jgi:hypothetical protein
MLHVVSGDDPNATAKRLLITVALTTVAWLTVTFATKPESEATLVRFFARVRPSNAGWAPIASLAPPSNTPDSLGISLIDWLAALALVYGALFGIGQLIFGKIPAGLAWLALAVAALTVILRNLGRLTRPETGAASRTSET